MNEFEDYYYGYMVPSAGYLKYFDLCLYDEGFVLMMPEQNSPMEVGAVSAFPEDLPDTAGIREMGRTAGH